MRWPESVPYLLQTKRTMKIKTIDLHVHSTKSDGTYTPIRLVDYAREKGLSAFALTDHDTIDGLEEAIAYADSLRASLPEEEKASVPEVIPGIELSTEYEGKDVHIVGLFIDRHNTLFLEKLKHFSEARENRNHKMIALLNRHGIDITYAALQETFPEAVLTRAHYAKYMYETGQIRSIREGFDKYFGDRGPCFVPRESVTPKQAIELILLAGGVPILAHPILYRMSDARLDKLVATLKETGLQGLEAVYSTYSTAEGRQIRKLAAKYDLLISGGSDFHGDTKPGLDLAVGYGKLFIPYEILEKIKGSRM